MMRDKNDVCLCVRVSRRDTNWLVNMGPYYLLMKIEARSSWILFDFLHRGTDFLYRSMPGSERHSSWSHVLIGCYTTESPK